MNPSETKVKVVLEDWRKTLLRIPGVTAVGRGLGSPQKIVIYVEKITDEILNMVPLEIDGVEVELRESGKIRMLSLLETFASTERTMRIRPIVGGVSLGCPQVTAGTFSCAVFDTATGEILGLSNNHVILAERWGEQEGHPNNPVLQPGVWDGGRVPDDIVGYTVRGIPVRLDRENLVDAAVFAPVNSDILKLEILDVGVPSGTITPSLGMQVYKSGRTTALTRSTVTCVDATVDVHGWGVARFVDQVIVEPAFAKGGDSGSCVLAGDGRVVGLVHAGSEKVTVVCQAANIEQLLGIRFGTVPVAPKPAVPILPLTLAFGAMATGVILYSSLKA